MQNKPSNDQHKSIYYRLRRSDPHERLSARLRHFSFGAAVFFVVAAAGIVTHSLYNIQIKQGATSASMRPSSSCWTAPSRHPRRDLRCSGITLASTSVVWTIWADPSYSTALFTSQTVEETGEAVKTVDETTLADVSRQLTLRLLSGDGESLDSVDTSSAEYQTQYQTVHDALAKNGSSYQVLATKVNNAVKLSIEKYISEYNKDHAKAKTLEDGTVIKKGRVSVSSSKSFQRDYPYGAFAASVLGFCNGDGEGFYGLEKSYDDTLAGVNGRTITLRNAYGNAIADANATTYAAKDGSNLVLSLDVNVQEVVERYLNEAIYANTVENRGAAIVMNVKTGAILAMASKPDFDPNAPLDFSENLAYLNEQVNAEPEIYTIYKKDANGSYLRMSRARRYRKRTPITPEPTATSSGRTRPSPSCTIPEASSRSSRSPWVWTRARPPITPPSTAPVPMAWQKRRITAPVRSPTASRTSPRPSGTAATSTSSSWVSGWGPASSTTTSTRSASPSAPAWICPTRRA